VLRETPNEGLGQYRIGPKLRALRLKRRMGLADLSRRVGLSVAMLSKVERGRLMPTLPTLYRISSVFGVGLDHFFGGLEQPPLVSIVRKKDRVPPPASMGRLPANRLESIEFAVEDPHIKILYAEFEPRRVAPADRHWHPGIEVLFVIGGRVIVSFDHDVEYLIESGDAMYFDSARPHGYYREGPDRCTALMVTTA
jgi:transcriptional regulator with XRE-family HTH domain